MGVVEFTDKGTQDDDSRLASFGVDAFSQESMPYYTRWIRQDLVGMFYMLSQVRSLLLLIAIPLWFIAYKLSGLPLPG